MHDFPEDPQRSEDLDRQKHQAEFRELAYALWELEGRPNDPSGIWRRLADQEETPAKTPPPWLYHRQ